MIGLWLLSFVAFVGVSIALDEANKARRKRWRERLWRE